jgi:hypothetical protein
MDETGAHETGATAGAPALIDPLLARAITSAAAEERIAALIQVRGAVREALAGHGAPSVSMPTELGRVARAQANGDAAPEGWTVALFPELGALYVAAPAAALARLLADPDVASATLPDQGP